MNSNTAARIAVYIGRVFFHAGSAGTAGSLGGAVNRRTAFGHEPAASLQ